MSEARERAYTGMAMVQTAINLMEQINTEVGGKVMDDAKVLRDERVVLRSLERMREKFLSVYENNRIDSSVKRKS